ncbi:hypothetical protein QYZ88_016045 [Lachnospiraceae bacterium C1.1]|nr:hypothetical protein [Lachnospiraceae bacterium C1.1]
MKKKLLVIAASLIVSLAFSNQVRTVFAADLTKKQSVIGVSYSFDEKSKYDFSAYESSGATSKENTYGLFEISGDISNTSTKDGLPSFGVNGGNIQLFYTYNDSMLNASGEQEHFTDDKSKTINDIILTDNI